MLQPPPSFQVPIRVLNSVIQTLNISKQELQSTLSAFGLALDELYPGNNETIEGEVFLAVTDTILARKNNPLQSLEIGSQLNLSVMWPLNELFLNSPDLYSAMSAPPEFHPLRLPFLRTQLSFIKGYFCVELLLFIELSPAQKVSLTEVYAQLIQDLAQTYIGADIPGCRLEFDYPKPEYAKQYEAYFNNEVHFSRQRTRYLIPIEYAHKSNAKANAQAFQLAKSICQQQLKDIPNHSLTMSSRVSRTLLSQALGHMNEEAVSSALFVSKRTLARRLDLEGTSFRKVKDKLLEELAVRQLQESEASIESIGILLGYSDVANFRRAFKRWQGMSPNEYRQAYLAQTL